MPGIRPYTPKSAFSINKRGKGRIIRVTLRNTDHTVVVALVVVVDVDVAAVVVDNPRVAGVVGVLRARPVIVGGQPSRICASSCGNSHACLQAGHAPVLLRLPASHLCCRYPYAALQLRLVAALAPLYRPACSRLSRWVKTGQHRHGESAGNAFITLCGSRSRRTPCHRQENLFPARQSVPVSYRPFPVP